jgi:hypothetical protein
MSAVVCAGCKGDSGDPSAATTEDGERHVDSSFNAFDKDSRHQTDYMLLTVLRVLDSGWITWTDIL